MLPVCRRGGQLSKGEQVPKVAWLAGGGLAGVCAATHTGLLRKGPLETVLLWVCEPCKGCSHSPAPASVQPSTSPLPSITLQWSPPRAALPSCALRKPASCLLSNTDRTEDRAVVVSGSQAAERQLPPATLPLLIQRTVGPEPWAPRKAGQFIWAFLDQTLAVWQAPCWA